MDLKCAIFIVLDLVGLYCVDGQCQPFISANSSGLKDQLSEMIVSWAPPGCTPILTEDKIIWQKLISGRWIDLFESSAENQNGYSLNTEGSYNLNNRSAGEIQGFLHKLKISKSTSCDSGTWNVHVVKDGKTVDSLLNGTLIINDTPEPSDIIVTPPDPSTLLADTVLQFTCTVDSLKPKAIVSWKFDTALENGIERGSEVPCGGDVWTVDNSISKAFNSIGIVDVECLLDQAGIPIPPKTLRVNISAPPKIVEDIALTPEEPKGNVSFTLTCTASGTDVNLSWTLNDLDLDMEYFQNPVKTKVNYTNLDYGQTMATVLTLTSRQFDSPTAETINKQSGEFKCSANVLSVTVKKERTVSLGHKPLANGDAVSNVRQARGFKMQLVCNVTAYPDPEYEWHRNDELLSDITRIIDIEVTEDCNYTCTAHNGFGDTVLFFIVSVDIPGGLTDGALAGIVIAVILCIAAIVGLLGFLYKKKQQQKADEEVVAYAESGNAGVNSNGVHAANSASATVPAVYAETNKDKKKSLANNTAGPVYSEVDKNKKTHREGATGPVYSEVKKPSHRTLPQLKPKPGSTNTGPVYSEVNKPKQGRLTPIENQSRGGGGGEYEDIGGKLLPPIKHNRPYDNAGQRNDHGGLHYADVDFLRQGNRGTKQTHDTKNPAYEPTEYAQIDHRKSAGIVV